MKEWILVKAIDGIIGPAASRPPEHTLYHSYNAAFEVMVDDIKAEGGGDYNEDYGYGTSDNGFVYEIFGA